MAKAVKNSRAREEAQSSSAVPQVEAPVSPGVEAGPEASDASGTNAPQIPAEGESGTAREAPSAGSGPEALQASGGTQSAPPSPLEERAIHDGEKLAEDTMPAPATAKAGAPIAAFKVLSYLLHDGVEYAPGATVLLAEPASDALLAVRAIAPLP